MVLKKQVRINGSYVLKGSLGNPLTQQIQSNTSWLHAEILMNNWIIEKAREFQKKTSTSASLTMLKPLTVWITEENSSRNQYQTTLPTS